MRRTRSGVGDDLKPAREIAGINPGRAVPRHVHRGEEPPPPQQVVPVRTDSRGRAPGSQQLLEVRGRWSQHRAHGVQQNVRIPHVTGRHELSDTRHDQHAQVPVNTFDRRHAALDGRPLERSLTCTYTQSSSVNKTPT